MKKLFILLIAAALVLAVGCAPQEVTVHTGGPAEGTVTVTGSAGIEVVPDMAVFTVGVSTLGTTSQQSRERNADITNAVIEALVALGIEEADIQTTGLNMWPDYNENSVVTGYRMYVDLAVTVRDLDQVGAAIDAATEAGANTMGGITMGISNQAELYEQALQEAVALARQKADKLAEAGGRNVGKLQEITEQSYSVVVNPSSGGKEALSMAADTAIMAGTTTVTAEVTATFTLE